MSGEITAKSSKKKKSGTSDEEEELSYNTKRKRAPKAWYFELFPLSLS
jgi:hypothetical protein